MIKHNSPLLLHVPHASTLIPAEELPLFEIDDLDDELLKMTDRYCDELFTGYESVVFPVSRLVCDPERFRSDDLESMSKVGMGAVYTSTSYGSLLRRVTPNRREALLQRYYDPHHIRLTEAVEKKLSARGYCLIVDGHSFPDPPLPYEAESLRKRPDFCIGTDRYHTPEVLAKEAAGFLSGKGFSVEFDFPFSGSMVPLKYYGREPQVYSIMIEINRRLYMDSEGNKNGSFQNVKRTVDELLGRLSERMEDVLPCRPGKEDQNESMIPKA